MTRRVFSPPANPRECQSSTFFLRECSAQYPPPPHTHTHTSPTVKWQRHLLRRRRYCTKPPYKHPRALETTDVRLYDRWTAVNVPEAVWAATESVSAGRTRTCYTCMILERIRRVRGSVDNSFSTFPHVLPLYSNCRKPTPTLRGHVTHVACKRSLRFDLTPPRTVNGLP